MPAIQPARLKIQSAQLAELLPDLPAFRRALHDLLDRYAERTRRPGQGGAPSPLLTAYKVPQPVLRQILKEITPRLAGNAAEGLALCDLLWAEPVLEFRLLAALMLGEVPADPPEAILERVQAWAGSDAEERLLSTLLGSGLARVRRAAPERFLRQVEAWLASERTRDRQIGLRAILPLLAEPAFNNLPVLYRLLSPLVRDTPPALRHDLLAVLKDLARRAPQETAYFLRQNLEAPHSAGTAWLVRQCLPAFPPAQQTGLREAMKLAGERR